MHDRNRQTVTIFAEALECGSAAERAAYLDRACAGDAALREQVNALLRAHEAAGNFLRGHSAPTGAAAPAAPPADLTGTRLGPYRLMEQIGEGGMGLVFVAEQQEPVRRKVALKVIKPGMDTREVIARFEAERQALALMDHPHIAKVFDAGTIQGGPGASAPGAGRPYFVMELVRGVPITDYCDQAQLTPRQRLELFVRVCQAVQHAHQKGVIHRDLKPSNVLVTLHDGTPVPKVIDFGVAKAVGRQLTERTLYTHFAQMVGTPLYMSPEQAELSGLDIDTRSDIYSLGVLLYELLTGTTPFDKERLKQVGFDELRRIIREEEPPKPSTRLSTLARAVTTVSARRRSDPKRLSQFLRGELDWIVMKALAKDRNERYATAKELADDVGRFLEDRPVQAGPPSAWYRLRKFARRNRRGLALAGLVLVFLGVLGGGAGWVAGDRAARQEALQREVGAALDEARDFCRADRLPEASAAVQRAAALLAGGGGDDALALRLGRVRADVHMASHLEAIRLERAAVRDGYFDSPGAERRYRDAFRDYGLDLAGLDADQAAGRIQASGIRSQLLAALDDWLLTKTPADRTGRARLLAALRRADDDPWRNRLRQALQPPDKPALKALARHPHVTAQPPATVVLLGDGLTRAGERQLAIRVLRSAQQRHPGDFWLNQELASSLMELRPVPARDALGYYRAALAVRPDSPGAHYNLGNALRARGDLAGAAASYRQAIALQPGYAEAYCNLGTVLDDRGDLAGALAAYRKAVARKPDSALAHYDLGDALRTRGDLPGAVAALKKAVALRPRWAKAHYNLGLALRAEGDLAGAVAAFQKAIRLEPDWARLHYSLGNALRARGDLAGAAAAFQKAIALKPGYAGAYCNLGDALYRNGDLPGAVAALQKAIGLEPGSALAHYNLGNALRARGDLPGAVAAYQKAIALKPRYAEAHCNLGLALQGRGDLPGAVAAYRRAITLQPSLAMAHNNLGLALHNQGDLAGALAAYRKAIALEPDLAMAHYNLGNALRAKGDLPGAAAAYRKTISLQPAYAEAHCNLGLTLYARGDLPGAIAAYRKAIAHKPTLAEAYCNLGLALHDQGDLTGALAALRKALTLKPGYAEAHYNLGLALQGRGDLPGAIAAYRKAIALRPAWAMVHYNLGNALRAQGDLAGAGAAFRKAIALQPEYAEAHGSLGNVLLFQGKFRQALAAIRRGHELGSKRPGWPYPSAQWVRQCERLVELDGRLPAILKGTAAPAGAAERIELAEVCSVKRLSRAAVRFYEEAFADRPQLLAAQRYNAACAAARAGCGRSQDAAQLTDRERTRLRSLALGWLRDELARWAEQPAKYAAALRQTLRQWQRDPDLAGVREPDQLAKLPRAERAAWRRLWAEVAKTLDHRPPVDAKSK
jgi:tetratricopeptide (TPR) repeat protein